MTIDKRIENFIRLGKFLNQFSEKGIKQDNSLNDLFYKNFTELIETVHIHNPWFTEENVRYSIHSIAKSLETESLLDWISTYLNVLKQTKETKRVGIISSGNIPMAGFHDMLCVLISGNTFVGKLSSDDKILLPFITKILIAIDPEFNDYIEFTENQLKNPDAIIATGSNNSARYFEYYFGKYQHIIRKNRNSIAVLSGNESNNDLRLLGKDVFQYFGLGCRNVSKLFVPKGYTFDDFYQSVYEYKDVINNNKYANNYEYNKTVYLMGNKAGLLDNNFLLLKEDTTYSSPIGVLFYEFYTEMGTLNQQLENDKEQIQCIVSNCSEIKNALAFGLAQSPKLTDYADGIDTMKFLLS